VELKNTKAKKWLRVDETGTAVLVSSKRKGGDQELLQKQDKKDNDKKRRKRDKIKDKLKEKLGSDNAVTAAEASGDDEDGTARGINRNTSEAATKRENSGFGWSVVRPSEECLASTFLLTELFADLNAAHAYDEERLAKLANLLA
jgi:hypothetical protein